MVNLDNKLYQLSQSTKGLCEPILAFFSISHSWHAPHRIWRKIPPHLSEAQSIIHRTRWVVNTMGEKIFVSSSSPRPFFRIITLAHRRACCNRGKSCYNNVRCAARNTAAQKEGRPEFAAISCWGLYAGPVHFTARKLRQWRSCRRGVFAGDTPSKMAVIGGLQALWTRNFAAEFVNPAGLGKFTAEVFPSAGSAGARLPPVLV